MLMTASTSEWALHWLHHKVVYLQVGQDPADIGSFQSNVDEVPSI